MVELLVVSDGRTKPSLVVRKHVDDPERLAHQVRWLTRAQGPGVVRVHAVDAAAGWYSTRFAGPLSLAAARADPEAMVSEVAATWVVLERIHRLGLAHGSVSADHVVVGRSGPLLISPGGPDPDEPDLADRYPGHRFPDRRSNDIARFGVLLDALADVWAADGTTSDVVIKRWKTVGRRVAELGDHRDGVNRPVSGAEIRGLLAELLPGRRSVGRATAPSFRMRRRYESGRDRPADRQRNRS